MKAARLVVKAVTSNGQELSERHAEIFVAAQIICRNIFPDKVDAVTSGCLYVQFKGKVLPSDLHLRPIVGRWPGCPFELTSLEIHFLPRLPAEGPILSEIDMNNPKLSLVKKLNFLFPDASEYPNLLLSWQSIGVQAEEEEVEHAW